MDGRVRCAKRDTVRNSNTLAVQAGLCPFAVRYGCPDELYVPWSLDIGIVATTFKSTLYLSLAFPVLVQLYILRSLHENMSPKGLPEFRCQTYETISTNYKYFLHEWIHFLEVRSSNVQDKRHKPTIKCFSSRHVVN